MAKRKKNQKHEWVTFKSGINVLIQDIDDKLFYKPAIKNHPLYRMLLSRIQ